MFQNKKNKNSEYQQYLNIYEIFSKDEINSLKKFGPEINNLFRDSFSTIGNSNKNSFIKNSPIKEPSKKLISKKQFYTLILEEIQKYFEQKKESAMSKIIKLLINEIISISKIVKENQILNEFFDNIKKDNSKKIEDSKKLFNLDKNSKEKNGLNQKSEKQFESIIINGGNFLNNFQPPKKYINKNSSSFSEIYHANKINDKNQIENGINIIKKNNDIISKDKNDAYYSFNKIKINGKDEIYKNINYYISKSNKKVSISNNKKQLLDKEHNSSKSANKYFRNNNNFNNYSVKNKLNFAQANVNKKSKKTTNKLDNNSNKVNKEKNSKDFSIINFAKSHSEMLNDIESENFDIFELDKIVGRSNILPLIGYYIFNRLGFHEILNYNKFEQWCKKIDEGYLRSNSYHTNIHSADVTQTCLIYLKLGELDEICNFTKNSKFSLILSCICHDFKHPGVNNNFLKETKNPLALEYNDASILENMHLAETFKLINSNDTYNIFDKIENNIYKQFRKEMISCVLATDMAFHNNYVNFLKYKVDDIKKEGKNINKNDDYQNFLNLLIHSADISNPTKPFNIYFKWAKLVVNEFYDQGDKEKKLGMNCTCDRNKVTIYQSQLGFINFIEIPFFSLFAELFPKLKFYNDQLIINKNKLISMEQEEKKENEKLNN